MNLFFELKKYKHSEKHKTKILHAHNQKGNCEVTFFSLKVKQPPGLIWSS